MKRRFFSHAVLPGTLLLFSGPCLPSGYFSQLLANSGVAVVGAVLSRILKMIFPQ